MNGIIALFFATALALAPIQVHAFDSSKEGCVSGDCQNGSGVYIKENGDRYEGEFVNGTLHGKGKVFWTDGNRYEGDFANGKLDGQGVYTWADGSWYAGSFKDDALYGKGKIYSEDNIVENVVNHDSVTNVLNVFFNSFRLKADQ